MRRAMLAAIQVRLTFSLVCRSGLLLTFLLIRPAWAQDADAAIGSWNFDDAGSSGAITDATSSQWHASRSGSRGEWLVPGKAGRALRFPAAGMISLDRHAAALGKLNDFTLSMWIQYDGGASRQLFTFSDGTLNHRVQIEVHNDALHFGWQDGGPFAGFDTGKLTWTPGTWYHVVFVNDARAGKSILRSNDLVLKRDANTLSPAGLRRPVQRVEIGSLNGKYPFNGNIDEVQLFGSALPLAKQLELYEKSPGTSAEPKWKKAKDALVQNESARQHQSAYLKFVADDATLSPAERQRRLDWLFQAEDDDLITRSQKEIGWTRELIHRLEKRAGSLDLRDQRSALEDLEKQATDPRGTPSAATVLSRYFAIRQLKRQVLFKAPEIDFAKILCVDAPYPRRSPETHGTFQQNEWVHESRFRSEMCAAHGAKLLMVDAFSGAGSARVLAPPEGFGKPVAMFSFDLSFDARRALFCMKPEDQKAFHLYEIGLDGSTFHQVTTGGYCDIDPIYLPDGRFLFLSTRSDVYAQCGMWARSYNLTRCDSDGKNIYILSPATEPEYSPSLLADGRVLFTRWEYVDKFANRIQSLWTMRPDGTGATTCWGNQSVYPDHLGEARQIPGTSRILFSSFGHHDVWHGCIGVVDPARGLNFPDGIWKITQELPWPEVGDGPVPTPAAAAGYHTSGKYAAYKTPYPLSEELFLVSARTGERSTRFMHSAFDRTLGKFKLYLMDLHGNRELLCQGENNLLYAQPVRPRKAPPILPDLADFPGSEKNAPVVRPGLFFSSNIFDRAPAVVAEQGRFLRVVEILPKNYSIGIVSSGGKPFGAPGPNSAWGAWGEKFLAGKTPTPTTDVSWGDSAIFSGPATSLTGPLAVKQVRGTIPIRKDGSVCFEAPPCRMLYFQVLDQHERAIHTMRSWVSVRPGEQRGCVGCHELHNATYAGGAPVGGREPDKIRPPAWGVRSLSYIKDIQPIFDRACIPCHGGNGPSAGKLDLTLRPDPRGRWGGIFPEPYLTLLMGKDHQTIGGACPAFDAKKGYLAVPNTIATRYDTLAPLSYFSPQSRLVARAMDKTRCGRNLSADDLRMLIAWIDLWAMYRSDDELRQIEDPPAEWFPLWSSPPRTRTAPRVRTEYSQDEYQRAEDRLK